MDLHLKMRPAGVAGAFRVLQSMLRYQRRPEGLIHEIGLPAHRGMPHAYVTAHHFRDMLNMVDLQTLIDWSKQPGLLPRVRSGPERGRPWGMIDDVALEELARDREIDMRFSAETELRRRGHLAEPTAKVPPTQRSLF